MQKFKTTNAGSFVTDGKQYQVFTEGIEVSKIKLPRNINIENRESFFFAQGIRFISLNPDVTTDTLFTYLNSLNRDKTIIKLSLAPSKLIEVVNKVFKYREYQGDDFEVKSNHIRKIIFADNTTINKSDQRKIINKEVGNMKTERTKQKIYSAIESWDYSNGKITARSVAHKIGMSLDTVKRYWSEFKEYAKDVNKSHLATAHIVNPEPIVEVPVEYIAPVAEDDSDLDSTDTVENLTKFSDLYNKEVFLKNDSSAPHTRSFIINLLIKKEQLKTYNDVVNEYQKFYEPITAVNN